MFVTADMLVAHAVGDYVLQSDWMASEKTKRSVAALAHAATYSLVFLFFTTSWKALAVILWTHFFIDRFRLARYVVWAKNFLSPSITMEGEKATHWWWAWSACKNSFGYPPDRPAWLACWLMIIADNIIHIVLNAAALRWL
jgi:hypothetical protein